MSTKKKQPVRGTRQPAPIAVACADWRPQLQAAADHVKPWLVSFGRRHWKGTLLIAVATTIFFWPFIMHLDSYSPGGDANFNAWTLARDQHCLLREACPNYANSNIFFPHTNSMLYSEAQLSTALVTMPLHWLSANPLLAYNVATIVSFFLSGWGVYLLVKYLSRGREAVSLLAGLAFEFAPLKMAAIGHLQNLSIFCLPFAVLLVLKFLEAQKRRYLVLLALALLYVFWASWVQMVFVVIAITLLLFGLGLFKFAPWKSLLIAGAVMAVSALTTLPLALQYMNFAKINHAAFSVFDQELYNSSVVDYFTPHDGTLLGIVYYKLRPGAVHNAYNLDSFSYHGVVLYMVGIIVLALAWRWRKRSLANRRLFALAITFAAIGVAGVIISLGPFLKLRGHYLYEVGHGISAVIPLPYALVDKFLPQLHFIRAVGRASVLFLFVLCVALAFVPELMGGLKLKRRHRRWILGVVAVLIVVELLPAHLVPMNSLLQDYQLGTIPRVYSYIVTHPEIDDIVILRGNDDYANAPVPTAQTEDVLWAGYHNRNIFNGYSGYTPPEYMSEYINMINFTPAVIPEMHSLRLRYVLIDKLLSGPTSRKPQLLHDVSQAFPMVYQDDRYALFRIT